MAFSVNATADTFNWSWSTSQILAQYNVTTEDIQNLVQSTAPQVVRNDSAYCGREWDEFRNSFIVFHGVASTIVCLFGLITNILNIIVLTCKDMASPTNSILTGLAVADMLVMIDYLPFTLVTYVMVLGDCVRYSYGMAVFTLFHAHFSVVCHTVSIGLTLTLAVWRYVAVSFPQNNLDWCNHRRARIAILACYVFPVIFCAPVYASFEVQHAPRACPGGDAYAISLSAFSQRNHQLMQKMNFWVYSVCIKLLPCAMLTVFSLQLIRALYRTNRRRMLLQKRKADGGDRSCDRTTRMLLAVLLLFLITEFPQGILALLSATMGEDFFRHCYDNLSEVMDLLALINSAINFILYCVMSRQFRTIFSQLFKPKILNKWVIIPQEPSTLATTCV